MYLNTHAFSHSVQPTINPIIFSPNHHSIRPTAAESSDIKPHNCLGSWFTFFFILSLQLYLNGYLMLSPTSFSVFEVALHHELFSPKLTLHSVFSRTATYPANRSFPHFTVTQLEIEHKESATETAEGSQKDPLASKTAHIRKKYYSHRPESTGNVNDCFCIRNVNIVTEKGLD